MKKSTRYQLPKLFAVIAFLALLSQGATHSSAQDVSGTNLNLTNPLQAQINVPSGSLRFDLGNTSPLVMDGLLFTVSNAIFMAGRADRIQRAGSNLDVQTDDASLSLRGQSVLINGLVPSSNDELEIFGTIADDPLVSVRLTPQSTGVTGALFVNSDAFTNVMGFQGTTPANSGSSPFAVGLDAPSGALLVDPLGNVGMGGVPTASLHVLRDDGTAALLVEESTSETRIRNLATLVNNGPSRLQMQNTDSGRTWSLVADFQNSFQIRQNGPNTANFAIREDGTFSFNNLGTSVMALQPDGNLRIGGVLTEGSSRDIKENIETVNPSQILAKVVDLPISTWNYITDENDTQHLGPMAQDFHATFGLGDDETKIATLDTSGVALAAIKGLNDKLNEKVDVLEKVNAKVSELEKENAELHDQNEELLGRLDRLEAMVEALD